MKHLLGIFFVFIALQASTQRYILFNPSCMERLKYDANSELSSESMIYVVKLNNEKIYFEVSRETKTLPRINGSVLTCNSPGINRALVDQINNSTGGDQYYVVVKESQGVLRTSLVTTASAIKI
ncbi:MAG: hypothetical protein HC892_18050 [Saprospiraceae bacterium]|nr:hypothetical protein [Saprospiraceae bacterium]